MPVPTEQQLDDAFRDLNDLELIVNGGAGDSVQTRTGGVKPTVAKVVNDALAADILAGGAGLALAIGNFEVYGNTPMQLAAIPQLAIGTYLLKSRILISPPYYSNCQISVGIQFASSIIGNIMLNLTAYRNASEQKFNVIHGTASPFSSANAEPIALASGTQEKDGIDCEILLKLDEAAQPLFTVRCFDQNYPQYDDNNPAVVFGAVEITQIA